jgi:sugar O-acyltransferase (sialic acid O-acetyltransferase NeuD family)
MILAGAGGHALEVYDILASWGLTIDLEVYDADLQKKLFHGIYRVQHQPEAFGSSEFCLGIGAPIFRKQLYQMLKNQGKSLYALRGAHSVISPSAQLDQVDVFHHCFIGPNTQLGIGCLVNTAAHIHHEVTVGAFTVINPGAYLLGAVQVGEGCSIGSHATILPGIKIGNHAIIGAGSVITRNVEDGATVVGVPGKTVGS